jgi:predicted membrane-bound mannosyltransferase
MPSDEHRGSDDWRLGIDPHDPHDRVEPAPLQPLAPQAQHGGVRSARRLERPLFVVTAEHLGWILVAAYTILTRVAALSTRPMFPGEAARALGEYALAAGGQYPATAARALGWIGFAQIGIFHALGASDMSARVVAALSALLLLGAAFVLRGAIGRAGALALAAMYAISPALLYFSSFGTTASAAIALVMLAVAVAMALIRRPTATRAAALAIALALAISGGTVGAIDVITAILALAIVGVINAIAGGNAVLRIRVWWTRRGWLLVAGAIVFAAVWIVILEMLSTDALHVPFASLFAPLADAVGTSALSAPRLYLAIAGFYEFAIVLAALAGVIAILARQVKSYFAGWCLVWMIVSIAAWTIGRPYRAEFALGFLVPMALLGAWGIQWLHELEGWDIVRYPVAAIAILAIYAQFVTSAVIAAPNASEAQWERRASLLWDGPATTIQTRAECARAIKSAGPGATTALPGDAPAIAWYLRALAPSADPANATVVATRISLGASADSQFGFEESWKPDFSQLTVSNAARFILTAHAWSAVEIEDLAIEVRQPPSAAAPPAPAATPSATATVTPTATTSATPGASPSPTASPTASASASPSASPSPK